MSDIKKRAQAYADAGVDIEAGNAFVGQIKGLVASTFTRGVVTGIGGFGGLFRPDLSGMAEPLLVAGTDGVGTKLKLAFALNIHGTIGIDLVAMSANDVLVQGATPLFFLDYFASGRLDSEVAVQVVAGVAEGCRQSNCALLGGETAEMPGFYPDGEYDLSGFCVGLVDRDKLVDGSSVKPGDLLVGLGSSGPHSNGYSLIRKLFDASGLGHDAVVGGMDKPLSRALLEPTRIYVRPVLDALAAHRVSGMVHVTGGGFYDNIPRVLPEDVAVTVDFGSWPMPPVFDWLREAGSLSWPEMLQIFNCGIGYILIVPSGQAQAVADRLAASGETARIIGQVVERGGREEQVEIQGI